MTPRDIRESIEDVLKLSDEIWGEAVAVQLSLYYNTLSE